ncbi:MAG TPA: hypothetical protein VFT62_08325 [Mycobacteriales bacterium]|nr:hypothetical protein [Mycobacteriales bacterium]
MTFWALVGVGYAVLLMVGFVLGRLLAARFGGAEPDGGVVAPAPTPADDPTFGLDWPPLGSAFDRMLLPAAFAAEPAVPGR